MTSPQRIAANADDQDEFIDLAQIARFVQRNLGALVTCVLLAMACGAGLFATLPSRWQAQATVEVGQVPLGTPVSGSREVALIEPPAQTAARLKQRELINLALASLEIPVDQPDNARAALIRRTVKTTVVKNANFIQIEVAGYSQQEARDNLAAIARTLLDAHSKLMLPVIKRVMAQLEDNAKQMAAAQTDRNRLLELLANAQRTNSRLEFAPTIVAINQLANKDVEIRQITVERAELQDAITPSRTYPTRIIDAVYVEPRPYFPKLSQFLAGAALLGLVLGMGVAWYRDRQRAAKLPAP